MLTMPIPALAILVMIGAVAYLGLQHVWLARNTPDDNLHRGVSWLTFAVLLVLTGRLVQLGRETIEAATLGIRIQWIGMLGMASVFVLGAVRRRAVRWWPVLLIVPIAAFVLLFWTHAFVTEARLPRVGFFGNRYYSVGTGPLARVAQLAGTVWAVAWIRAAMRAHAWTRWTTTAIVLALVTSIAAILHDTAMNAGRIHSVHAIDYAVVAVTFTLSHVTTRRWRQHLVSLETAVVARTTELASRSIELERALRELGESRQRLELADRMASLGTLAAGVAHEINNPLAYLLSNVQVARERIREDYNADEELSECLADAEKGCLRVKEIVEDMRELTRVPSFDAGPKQLHPILEECLQNEDDEIRRRARVVRSYGDVPEISAADGRLAQVFRNLIINAVQAMPVGEVDRMQLEVSTYTDALGRAVVEIRDTGVGIPEEIASRVFEPFFTTKEPGRGAGLGLSVCHSIVTSLGGTIALESIRGSGTLVRVALPAATGTDAATGRHSNHPLPDERVPRSRRILRRGA